MGRAVRIREHREPQFKLESLSVHDSKGAVAVVQLHTEKATHVFYNHTRSLHGLSEKAIAVPSPEDVMMEDQEQQERRKLRRMLMEGLGSCLTPAQRRRLWLHCVDELTVRQIAEAENVRHPSVVECLTAAKEKLQDFLKKKG